MFDIDWTSAIENCRSLSATGLIILPTTQHTIAWANSALQDRLCEDVVVASLIPNAVNPSTILDSLALGSDRPRYIVVFTDQLTSAIESPILVRSNNGSQYYSGLESVLHLRYRYPLYIWPHALDRVTVPSVDLGEVIQQLTIYFDACNTLGNLWLQREAQKERSLTQRVMHARRELRYLKSILLHNYRHRRADIVALELLSRIDSVSKRVSAMAEVM